jgi:hypothetical protein
MHGLVSVKYEVPMIPLAPHADREVLKDLGFDGAGVDRIFAAFRDVDGRTGI